MTANRTDAAATRDDSAPTTAPAPRGEHLRHTGWGLIVLGVLTGSFMADDPNRTWHGSFSGDGQAPCLTAGTCTSADVERWVQRSGHHLWAASGVILLGVLLAVLAARHRPARVRRDPARWRSLVLVVLASGLGWTLLGGAVCVVVGLGYGWQAYAVPAAVVLVLYRLLVELVQESSTPLRARAAVLVAAAVTVAVDLLLGRTLFVGVDDDRLVLAVVTYLAVGLVAMALATRWAVGPSSRWVSAR